MQVVEKPLLVRLIGWVQLLFSWTCALFASPFYLFLYFTQPLVTSKVFTDENGSVIVYLALCFPRWLVATLAFPIALFELVVAWYIGYYPLQTSPEALRQFISALFIIAAIIALAW